MCQIRQGGVLVAGRDRDAEGASASPLPLAPSPNPFAVTSSEMARFLARTAWGRGDGKGLRPMKNIGQNRSRCKNIFIRPPYPWADENVPNEAGWGVGGGSRS